MKILVIGDFHGIFPLKLKKEVRNADLVLCTGDFGGSDKLLNVIFKYFEKGWWNIVGEKKVKQYILEDYNSGIKIMEELNSFEKTIYVIPGNWDFLNKSKEERTAKLNLEMYPPLVRRRFKNLKWWNRGLKVVNGIRILAFGGMVTAGAYLDKGVLSDKKRRRNIQSNKEEVKQIMAHGKDKIDILFSHYPLYGFFDIVRFKGKNPMNGKHIGFKGFTQFVKKYSPKLAISGHLHEYQGHKRFGKTLIVETGAAKEGKAVIIDYPDNKKGKIKVKFIK